MCGSGWARCPGSCSWCPSRASRLGGREVTSCRCPALSDLPLTACAHIGLWPAPWFRSALWSPEAQLTPPPLRRRRAPCSSCPQSTGALPPFVSGMFPASAWLHPAPDYTPHGQLSHLPSRITHRSRQLAAFPSAPWVLPSASWSTRPAHLPVLQGPAQKPRATSSEKPGRQVRNSLCPRGHRARMSSP